MTTGRREVAIVTPWYPTRDNAFRGAFVRAMVEATAPECDRATVYHCDQWWTSLPRWQEQRAVWGREVLLSRAHVRSTTVGGAELVYVPVPMPHTAPFARIADRHAAALRAVLGGKPLDAPVIHAHVGIYSGWAALQNAHPDSRLFVTEHATFIGKVLAEPEARRRYEELLARVVALFAVGEELRQALIEAFPHHAARIVVVPNAISFGSPREQPVTQLRRWIYVGSLIPRKGVDILLDAFARVRADDPNVTLTMVGGGKMLPQLVEAARRLGVADAVTFTGPVTPDESLRLMREHDLLVHPSRHETFGVTVVEALASGIPVLVTRCGGPEQTLAGIEEEAGELIDISDDPGSIVAGYRRLVDRFPHGLDLPRARTVLEARYGYRAVAEAHSRAWFPTSTQAPAAAAQ